MLRLVRNGRRLVAAHPLVALCLAAALAVALWSPRLGHHLDGPLAGKGDTSIWEPMGFYVAQNLHFRPLPQLSLSNDQAFYPYGTDQVFQPWGFERDLFFAGLFSLFGPGPWLQLYYLGSLFVTIVGAALLLRRDFGVGRAALAGFLVTFFNFYASHKYPGHLHICVLHWTVLSVIADFVIVRRVAVREPVGLRLLLARAALTTLSVGQDLGYIAGFSLMSLVLSALVVAALVVWRRPAPAAWWRQAVAEARAHGAAVAGLTALLLLSSALYVPIAFQLAREARRFDFSAVPSLIWFASPWRLLLPYFPGFNPVHNPLASRFLDRPEGLGGGALGWTLLVPGLFGLVVGRRQWRAYLPLVAMLALCLAYHPVRAPTLKVFPWFAFSRVADRTSGLYPVMFVLFALPLDLASLRARWLLRGGLAVLGAVELVTSCSLGHSESYRYDRSFFDYMAVVRGQPGEAVLDWPFCVIGGNAVGAAQGLCPFYRLNHEDFSYRTYHRKKVVGQYFGRLHPDQLAPFLRARWDLMFLPDSRDPFEAHRQLRCFSDDEWRGFTDFFTLNDFAGIQLHRSLLPPSCLDEFYRRFGRPLASTTVPDGDDLAFLPKPDALRAWHDPATGRRIVLVPYRDLERVDLLSPFEPRLLRASGLSWFEQRGPERWRWGSGDRTSLEFSLSAARPVTLRYRFVYPPRLRQRVAIWFEGKAIATAPEGNPDEERAGVVTVAGRAGLNQLEIRYRTWNGQDGDWFAPDDQRPMTVRWTELVVD